LDVSSYFAQRLTATLTDASGNTSLLSESFVVTAGCQPGILDAAIENPGFNNTDSFTVIGWEQVRDSATFSSLGSASASPSGMMPTEGGRSLRLSTGNNMEAFAGEQIALTQTVDFSLLSTLRFDAEIAALEAFLDKVTAKVRIGGVEVWSETQEGFISDEEVDVSAISGEQLLELVLEVREGGTYSTQFVYFDNVRALVVCEPSEGEGEGEGEGSSHSADQNQDGMFSFGEVLRVIQLYNSDRLGCDGSTEDGYIPNGTDETCAPHSGDYNPPDWVLSLRELLRIIQLFNAGAFTACDQQGEDGFCIL
jgi:hypothetical protein